MQTHLCRIVLAAWLALSLSGTLRAEEAAAPEADGASTNVAHYQPFVVAPKPAVFTSLTERLDYINANLPYKLDSYVKRTDSLFAGDVDLDATAPVSKFRLTTYVQFNYDDGVQLELNPSFDAEVELPNLESKWNVFVQRTRNDELPSVDPVDAEGGSQAGIRHLIEDIHIESELGVNLSWIPSAYAQVEWKREWVKDYWVIRPSQKGYYDTEDGFGEITSLRVHRWFGGEKPKAFFQYVTGAKWTEQTEGVSWEQSARIGYVTELIQSKWTWMRTVGNSDMARGWAFDFNAFGHSSGETVMDKRRVRLTYRMPLYERWIFLEITPGVEWERENNWNTTPSIRVALDMLLWGNDR